MPAKKDEKKEPETSVSVEVDLETKTAQVNVTGKFDADALISLAKQISRAQVEVS